MSVRRSVGVVVAVALVGAVLGFTGALIEGVVPDDSPVAAPVASAAPVAGGLGYTALVSPCRAVDTRKAGGPIGPGGTRDLRMRGSVSFASQGGSDSGCGVPSTASAVEVSITAVSPSGANGFVQASAAGSTSRATVLNYTVGRGMTNTGTIPLNTAVTNDLGVSNAGGTIQLVVDIQGYFTQLGGAAYVPLASPCRVADTRNGGGVLGDGVVRSLQVAGSGANFAAQGGTAGGCGVPDEVPGVELSLTVITPTGANGFVQVSPSDTSTNAAFINYTAGTGITNTGSVTLSAGGPIDLQVRNLGGSIQVAIDVQGYYTNAPGTGTRYQTVAPCRTVDTRNSGGPLAPGQTRTFQTAGVAVGFTSQGTANASGCEVPQRATAVEASVTAVSPSGTGFTRPGPAGSVPAATFLNYTAVGGITNTGTLPLALGGLADLGITNAGGTTSYIVDVLGYYEPSPEFPRSVEVVAAGSNHTCVTAADNAYCWGSNTLGQLGDGGVAGRGTPPTGSWPQRSHVIQVVGGASHSCSLAVDPEVSGSRITSCWGDNSLGQVGDGTSEGRLLGVFVQPVIVGDVQLAAGFNHTCVLTSGGAVSCWGANSDGQLGDGSTVLKRQRTSVTGLTGAVQVAAGGNHSCALLAGGTVRCWGDNQFGQLGDGTTTDRSIPTVVPGLTGVVQLDLGSSFSCARLASGAVRCWGDNASGQVGDGTTGTNRLAPTAVSGVGGAVQVATGGNAACALLGDGSARCWGDNDAGQVGDGTTTDRPTPVAVTGLVGAVQLDVSAHTCALLSNGTNRCWGLNGSGQVGDGTRTQRTTPTVVAAQSGVVQVTTGDAHACALLAVGQVRCWGDNLAGQLGDGTSGTDRVGAVTVAGLTGVVQIDAGDDHTCARLLDRTARCWGFNGSGQLGDGTSGTNRLTPVEVLDSLDTVREISAGGAHTCWMRWAAGPFGECWGFNFFGQLGNGTSGVGTNTTAPDTTLFLVARVTAGGNHSCLVSTSDSVAECWGSNDFGQVGDNTAGSDRTEPTPVASLGAVASISAGGSHTCATEGIAPLRCWGRNASGQVGDNSTSQRNLPTGVTGIDSDDVVGVAAGLNHTCAVLFGADRTSQSVACWGENADGRVGDGTSGTDRLTPVAVLRSVAIGPLPAIQLTGAVQVDVGGSHACAVLTDGTARCWGSNSDGQLGIGTVGGFRVAASAGVTGLADS